MSPQGWTILIVLAYACGHLAQALGNLIFSRLEDSEELLLGSKSKKRLPSTIISAAERKISDLANIDASTLDPALLYAICDEAIAWHGDPGDRDVYIYRQGFYRGMSVALAVLAAAILLRSGLAATGEPVRVSGVAEPLSWPLLIVLSIGLVGSSALYCSRFKRFGRYRVRHAVLGVVVMQVGTREPREEGGSENG
jgi:hypothetical protein